MIYVDLKTSQDPWNGSLGLGHANNGAQKDGRNDPEVQSRKSYTVGFHIDEDGITGSRNSCRGSRSEDGNPDRSDEEKQGDNDGKDSCRSIRSECTAGLTDC